MRRAQGLLISLLILVMFNSQASAQPGSGFAALSKEMSILQNADDRRYNERRPKHRGYSYGYPRPYYPPPSYAYAYPYPAPYPYYAPYPYAPYPPYYGPSGGVSLSLGF